MTWLQEIEDLHQVFEDFFLGRIDTLDRVDRVLAEDFTFVGPTGTEVARAEVMETLRAGHAHTQHLRITITEGALVFEDGNIVVARYVENHELTDASNHRLTTVIFRKDSSAPNALVWRRVHETWLSDDV